MSSDYIWPLSRSTTPDEMNTSFGPRINRNRWNFHDGIDLPAPVGTPVYAVHGGVVYRAGTGETDGFSSRHVVLKVNDPNDGVIYVVYLHLDSIHEAIAVGENITQSQLLGTVGEDGATYPHLHIEFRKGSPLDKDKGSHHPLCYLPYADTVNFTALVLDRFNRLGKLMGVRLLFEASNKLEGDLQGVEVDLLSGGKLIKTRIVDFNDKKTVNKGVANSDRLIYMKNIGVEGYQKSNMVAHGRTDLKHGILIRNIPNDCDALVARVIDIGGNIKTSSPIPVPNQTATNQKVDFEDGAMPPDGWIKVTSTSGCGTTVENDPTAAHTGSRGMLSIVASNTNNDTQRAGIEYILPPGRFEWVAEGWFNPNALDLATGQSIYLLHFLSGANLSVAARIHNSAGSLRAGIIVKMPDGTLKGSDSPALIKKGGWRKWKLYLLRVATRETTAVLYLDGKEKLRVNWDSTTYEPLRLRAGIGLSAAGATATVMTDEIRVTESTL